MGLARSEIDVFNFDEGDAPETNVAIERREAKERLQRQREEKEARQRVNASSFEVMLTSMKSITKKMYGQPEGESVMRVNVQDRRPRSVEQRAHSIPRSAQPSPSPSSTTTQVEEAFDRERSSQSSDSDDVEEVFNNAQVEASSRRERPTPMAENDDAISPTRVFSIFAGRQRGPERPEPPLVDENHQSTNTRGDTRQSPTPQMSMDVPPTTSTNNVAPPSRVYVVRQEGSRTNFGFGVLMSKGAGNRKLTIMKGGATLFVMIGYRILY